jgi:GNAT superfamily N-acetyltransferase
MLEIIETIFPSTRFLVPASPMPPVINLCSPLTPDVREAIIAPLIAHNNWHGMSLEGDEMGYALVDEAGSIAGGLLGYWRDRWLFIASLSVREDLRGRGYGRALMEQGEAWAQQHHGVGIWLDSYGFQAPDFYRHLGYEEMGRLPDYLPGIDRLWFLKRLVRSVPPEA